MNWYDDHDPYSSSGLGILIVIISACFLKDQNKQRLGRNPLFIHKYVIKIL